MTTPTQAQIEAAAKALYGDHGRKLSDKAMAMAKAALTAAAQVGEQDKQAWFSERYLDNAIMLERNATIERCAQVADKYPLSGIAKEIAAAIRKLKDDET